VVHGLGIIPCLGLGWEFLASPPTAFRRWAPPGRVARFLFAVRNDERFGKGDKNLK
jgi:hypothetical protein